MLRTLLILLCTVSFLDSVRAATRLRGIDNASQNLIEIDPSTVYPRFYMVLAWRLAQNPEKWGPKALAYARRGASASHPLAARELAEVQFLCGITEPKLIVTRSLTREMESMPGAGPVGTELTVKSAWSSVQSAGATATSIEIQPWAGGPDIVDG